MANVDRPQGFTPLDSPQGSVQKTPYPIAVGYDTDLFTGDGVTLVAGNIQKVTVGTAHPIIGFISHFECKEGIDKAGYYPADSTDHYTAIVCDDPDQLFTGQDDGAGTAMALDDIGKTGNLIATHTGDKTTMISGMEADASSFSGSGQLATDQLIVMACIDRVDNEPGANAEWAFRIHNHYLRQATHA